MTDYELTVIFAGSLGEKEIDVEVKELTTLLTSNGAKIKIKKDPVKKALEYEIAKNKEGYYVYFEFSADSISEIEKKLKLKEKIIRHLLIRS